MTHNTTDPQTLNQKLVELGRHRQMAQEGNSTAKAQLRPLTEALLPDYTRFVAERFGETHSIFDTIARDFDSGRFRLDAELDAIVKLLTAAVTSLDQFGQEGIEVRKRLGD